MLQEKPDIDPMEARLSSWAGRDPTVRAALLVGSRATPQGAMDGHSDYDVVLFLDSGSRLTEREEWLETFGRPLIVLRETVYHRDESVPTRLVQYRGGHRIDFTLSRVDLLHRIADQDNLPDWLAAGYRVLLDRDGDAARLPLPSSAAYVPRSPTGAEYRALVDEFWWETYYVGKYLARNELLPARYSLEAVLRYRCLIPMLEWYVQIGRGWEQSVGVRGRGLRWLLDPEERDLLDSTYAGSRLAEHRSAILAMTALFRRAARTVGRDLGYEYPEALDREMELWLREAGAGS
jgi:aminoglycoside 6-adenylyltransferase